MAKKLPKAAEPYKFKPGQSGNPNGRKPLTPEQRALKKLTIETYGKLIETALTGNIEELKNIALDPESSVIEAGVARSLLNAMKKGDADVFEKFAQRVVGKIPDKIQMDLKSENTHAHSLTEKEAVKAFERARELTRGKSET